MIRWSIGGLFLWAGVIKLMDPRAFAATVSRYGLVPEELLVPLALGLPLLEILAGLGTILQIRGSLETLFVMLVLFMAVLWFGILADLDVDCGCFSVGEQKEHVSLRSAFARDGALLLGVVYLGIRRFRTTH